MDKKSQPNAPKISPKVRLSNSLSTIQIGNEKEFLFLRDDQFNFRPESLLSVDAPNSVFTGKVELFSESKMGVKQAEHSMHMKSITEFNLEAVDFYENCIYLLYPSFSR